MKKSQTDERLYHLKRSLSYIPECHQQVNELEIYHFYHAIDEILSSWKKERKTTTVEHLTLSKKFYLVSSFFLKKRKTMRKKFLSTTYDDMKEQNIYRLITEVNQRRNNYKNFS